MNRIKRATFSSKIIVKICHVCNHLTESAQEAKKCPKCAKAFLPLNYFNKIHTTENFKYDDLFASSDELVEEELIKGIYVIW